MDSARAAGGRGYKRLSNVVRPSGDCPVWDTLGADPRRKLEAEGDSRDRSGREGREGREAYRGCVFKLDTTLGTWRRNTKTDKPQRCSSSSSHQLLVEDCSWGRGITSPTAHISSLTGTGTEWAAALPGRSQAVSSPPIASAMERRFISLHLGVLICEMGGIA